MPTRKILVPLDYSAHSEHVLRHALELGQRLSATVVPLHVWETMPHAPAHIKVVTADGPRPLGELLEAEARKEMAAFLERAGQPALPYELADGEPIKAILHAIEHGGFDLVVMGTHGRSGLSRMVIGSVAEKVLRFSPVPVLTVPMRAEDRAPAG